MEGLGKPLQPGRLLVPRFNVLKVAEGSLELIAHIFLVVLKHLHEVLHSQAKDQHIATTSSWLNARLAPTKVSCVSINKIGQEKSVISIQLSEDAAQTRT